MNHVANNYSRTSSSTVLIVEDDAHLRDALHDTLALAGYDVMVAEHGHAAMARMNEQAFGMVISDVQMRPMDGMELLQNIRSANQDIPVVMMTAYGTIEKAVDAMRAGASDYLVKPFDAESLINIVKRLLPEMSSVQASPHELIAVDEKMLALKNLAVRVAQSEATVLLCGESGVGKEVFARHIHINSKRAAGPFVAINCAAIPENMLEAVLFGYEKGAFTGAVQSHAGKFEQAQGGTLLLDEISEMDAALQAKLLRVLQEKEVERLGGRKTISLDVRVLATSNRNLREQVASGHFREDLFYRLSVFPLHIPPLRERVCDIIPMAERFLNKHQNGELYLSALAQQKLVSHRWAGNVRELDNVMQRALILRTGNEIDADCIQISTDSIFENQQVSAQTDDSVLNNDLKGREQQLILEALRVGKGSRKYAADKLGISARTLRYKLARMRDAGI
ncbi:MAG: sigma-54-dependent Fis family transcriptional regulator, partial [Gammaproteobacteria bacterium]|nr:sigma-54-dependent Fis family transcriptional regulator [Gammaproteobacteria bacterium]